MSENEGDVKAGFAALMSKAAEQADPQDGEAPYGYTRDRETGELRPKKQAGRPRRSPSVDELKAQRADSEGDTKPADRPPDARGAKRTRGGEKEPSKPVVVWHEGQIERGMNRLYRRAGKLCRAFDRDIGTALIEMTRKEDPDDITVGQAWEDVARVNPRIRVFCLRIISGGVYGALVYAHLPLAIAIISKDSVRRLLPLGNLMDSFLTPDTEPGGDGSSMADGTPFEGLHPQDMAQMYAMAQHLAAQAMGRMPQEGPRPPQHGPVVTVPGPEGNGS